MSSSSTRHLLVSLLAVSLANGTVAQTTSELGELGEYTPTVGQAGKDVIWVPTSEKLLEQMLQMANVGPEDYVIDLGSGDGRTVIMAAERFGARGLGIEYNPDMVALSKRNAERAGVSSKVDFVEADIFESDFSQGTVIAMYLLPSLNLRLRPRILAMPPGTRVVSNSFDMADWRPDDEVHLDGRKAYLWIVPADLAGSWEVDGPAEGDGNAWILKLDQDFQMLSGRVHIGNRSVPVVDGQIRGAEFRFHFVDVNGGRYDVEGRALGNSLEGTLRSPDGSSATWNAVPGRVRFSRTL